MLIDDVASRQHAYHPQSNNVART